jgi:hypothetical protein
LVPTGPATDGVEDGCRLGLWRYRAGLSKENLPKVGGKTSTHIWTAGSETNLIPIIRLTPPALQHTHAVNHRPILDIGTLPAPIPQRDMVVVRNDKPLSRFAVAAASLELEKIPIAVQRGEGNAQVGST